MASNDPLYVFDTSAFIDLLKKECKKDTSSPLWTKFNAIIAEERVISVRAVLNEIYKYESRDLLIEWAEKQNVDGFFPRASGSELDIVMEISETFFKDRDKRRKTKEGQEEADFYVIAKAKHISGYVVTEDGYNNKGEVETKRKGMAFVCQKIDVPCLNLEGFILREGLETLCF